MLNKIKEQTKSFLLLNETEMLNKTLLLRQKTFGRKISFCSIINARNGLCEMDCAFCAQSKNNVLPGTSWPMLKPDILKNKVEKLLENPISRIGIVTSGKKLADRELEAFCQFLDLCSTDIKKRICASFGSLEKEKLKLLKDHGLAHYHHNLETSENFYPNVSKCQKWRNRLLTVLHAKDIGLQVCSGGIFGIGETWDDRIDLALCLKEAEISHIPLNFFTPVKGTPLENKKILDAGAALKIIALFRFILPEATLRICGGRTAVLQNQEDKIFKAGANAMMTGNYLTTSGSNIDYDLQLLKQYGYDLAVF